MKGKFLNLSGRFVILLLILQVILLPSGVFAGNVQTFYADCSGWSFTLENLTNHDLTRNWEIYFGGEMVDSGTVTLLPNEIQVYDGSWAEGLVADGLDHEVVLKVIEDGIEQFGLVGSCNGSITVAKEAAGAGATSFAFAGDLGAMALADDGSAKISNLPAGDYIVTEVVAQGWMLDAVTCLGGDSTPVDDGVTIHLDFTEDIICTFTNVQLPPPAAPPVINEFVFNLTGDDMLYAFIELFGDPSTDYSNLTLLELEGDSSKGRINAVWPVGSTDANGFWVGGGDAQNGTATVLLVSDFAGSNGDDLDADDDGVLDSTPWVAIVDSIAVNDGGSGDLTYADVVLTRGFDGESYTVGGASRIPNGTDTDSVSDWMRNDYDGAGFVGFAGTPVVGEALNTPGAVNQAYIPTGADLVLVKTDDADPIIVGDAINYTLTVTNNGPEDAVDVVVTDTLPDSVALVADTPDQGSCEEVDGIVTCQLGTIANGDIVNIGIEVTTEVEGVLTNTAAVTSATEDTSPDNNTASAETTVNAGVVPLPDIIINELDSDTPGTDVLEFVELFDGGVGNTALDGLVVVFYNGSGDTSYSVFDLGGYTTDANGYFVLGNSDVNPVPAIIFGSNGLQNGADAVALYTASASDFPSNTALTTDNLIDALVYDTDDGDDAGLLPLLNAGQPQVNENGGGDKDNHSNQRCPDGSGGARNTDTYTQALPSPGAANTCGAVVDVAPTVSGTTPADNDTNVALSADINVNFSEAVAVSGTWFTISCTDSGDHSAVVSGGPQDYALTPDTDFSAGESCTVQIIAAQVTDQDEPVDAMAADYSFSFSVVELATVCGDTFTPIYEVQGSGATSPLVGTEVVVEGVVVGDFQNNTSSDNGNLNGFHIQDPVGDGDPATSDGVFIYASNAMDVSVGDAVRVRGNVSEYSGLTEISAGEIWQCSTGNSVAPTALALPVTSVDDFEAYEGMLVTFPQALVISEYFNFDRYNEIVLTSDRKLTPTAEFEPGADAIAAAEAFLLNKITLDDGRTTQNPDPALHPNGSVFDMSNLFRGGDTLQNVTGVLDYSFSLYRIQPTQGADYVNANPRPSQADSVGGTTKVASFNVLNYFSTIDTGSFICGPSQDQECRGADTIDEFTRQRDKIIAAVIAMDADVVGLLEIENNVNDEAVQDLVDGLNAATSAGTYDYIHTGAIGTDAIKVAVIYQPASVSPTGSYAVLDSTVDPRFLDTKNRPALAQTFTDNGTGGIFTVAVNHLKSKGSDCNDVSDPDTGDGSGNCNLTRTAAAEALVDWLATDPTGSGDDNFLIIGDLNAYDKEAPIDAIKAGSDGISGTDDDYTDMIFEFQGEDAYSYVFDGQTGYLDHALAGAGLVDQITGVTVWHINADEPDLIDYDMSFKLDAQDALYAADPFRASDHDPVIVGLNLASAVENPATVINEIRIDQPNADNDEYFELFGTPGASLDGLTYLVIGDGTGGSGVIEAVVNLSGNTIPSSGYFVAAESTFTLGTANLVASINFENNDNITHLLVSGFTGANGDDLDTNDDGVLDSTPWVEELDRIALVEEVNPPVNTEYHYGPPSVGPDGTLVPGHALRCANGWLIGQFDPANGNDTPGLANACSSINSEDGAGQAGGRYLIYLPLIVND